MSQIKGMQREAADVDPYGFIVHLPAAQNHDLTTRVRRRVEQKFEPLVSPDGVFWMIKSPFEVVIRTQRGLPTEIWLETKIYHFSRGALGEIHPDYDPSRNAACLANDIYIEAKVPTRLNGLRSKISNFNKNKNVLLGNATSTVSVSQIVTMLRRFLRQR